jgi:hypothetical protein
VWITAYPNRNAFDTSFEFEFWVEGSIPVITQKVYSSAPILEVADESEKIV